MAGRPGRSGGHNAISLEEHVARGTFSATRHGHLKPRSTPVPVSLADRRRVLRSLPAEGHELAKRVMDAYGNWDPASLEILPSYCLSCLRLRHLEQAGPLKDAHREARLNLQLLKAMNL